MTKIYPLLVFAIFSAAGLEAQTFQLFTENFEAYSGSFVLNADDGPGGAASGNNRWIVNNSYSGGFGYPNTTPEDSTVSGTIGGAPYSNYMHIYDQSGAPAITCASYDPSNASDNFTEMASGFCTLGLVNIQLTFFWISEGSPSAYGQVYYSADGGPWTPVGMPFYNNEHLWKYEVITDPAFENVEDLRFGFRWVNDAAGGSKTISFGIDDIIAVGTYDAVANPVAINIDFITPDPVCKLSTLVVGWSLSAPLCDGVYQVELSNSSGSFVSPTGLGVFNVAALDTVGAVAVIIPGGVPDGDCYKVRVTRISPLPYISGEASACFTIQSCPNTITTLPPVVTFDTNAVCVHSVIDVPFYSTGVFSAGNIYTAQLSDSTGNFDSPYTIGTFTSSATFDPALGSPPGTVSGIVPDVPPGCNYYVRVVSSSPSVVGSVYGPICIQDCDVETNDIMDVYVCITEETGDTVTITYDTHIFDDIEQYCDTNTFCVEVLDPMFFSQVSLCDLGLTVDTASGTITMYIPGYYDLLALGLDAGIWYMRVDADCGDPSENQLGTLVHLTIGAPMDTAPNLIPEDTLLCEGDISSVTVTPYNPNSDYQFQFGTGTPFIWPYNPIFIDFTGTTGDVTLRVREINYGCPGPWSDYVTMHVIDVPGVSISGPPKACTGDTVYYSVPYYISTYYNWTISGGIIADTANNEIGVVWDTSGTYTLTVFALNMCGSATGSKTVNVINTVPVHAGDDQSICDGDLATLDAYTSNIDSYAWYTDSTLLVNDFYLQISPDTTTTYIMQAEDSQGCPSSDSLTVYVSYPETTTDSAVVCAGTSIDLDAGYPGSEYNWSNGPVTQVITIDQPGTYTVTVHSPDLICPVTENFKVDPVLDICDPVINVPDAFSPNGDGVNDNLTVFGSSVTEYHITIYNRWGEIVYTSGDLSELNNPDFGWDGTFNGEKQDIGTYVYVISATGGSGKTIQVQGNIILLR